MGNAQLPRCEHRDNQGRRCTNAAAPEPTYLGLNDRKIWEMYLCEAHRTVAEAFYDTYSSFARTVPGDDVSLLTYVNNVGPKLYEIIEGYFGYASKRRRGYRLFADDIVYDSSNITEWLHEAGHRNMFEDSGKRRRAIISASDRLVWARAMTMMRRTDKGS